MSVLELDWQIAPPPHYSGYAEMPATTVSTGRIVQFFPVRAVSCSS
jgi:hypothetical protein